MVLKVLDIYYTKYALIHKNLCEKSDWILNHKNQDFDIAFIGNSRVIHMMDVNIAEKATGKSAINLGLTGANYAENYLVLDQFLKAGNTIKNLIIQVDMHSLNSTKELTYPFHNYNYMHYLYDTTVYNIFRDNNPAYKTVMWKYIPFTRYMEFSNKYVFYKIVKGGYECKVNEEFDLNKGSKFLTDMYDPHKQPLKYSYWVTRSDDEKYLNKLLNIAKSKNMNIIMYTAPVYHQYLHYLLGYPGILDNVKKLTKQMNIQFFDFSKTNDPVYADTINFCDNIHLNAIGTQHFSKILTDSIKPFLKN